MDTQDIIYEGTGEQTKIPPPQKKYLLIIDDEPDITMLVQNVFRNTAFHVWTANKAREGLRLAMIKKPDLILLDILMPEMDGVTTLKQLKHMSATADIPVVMLTGNAHPDTFKEALLSGAIDYLLKPIKPDLLKQRIEKWLDFYIE